MPHVNENISNFLNGVSQQAQTLRLPTQGEEQVNGLSSIVDHLPVLVGVEERAPGSGSPACLKSSLRSLAP